MNRSYLPIFKPIREMHKNFKVKKKNAIKNCLKTKVLTNKLSKYNVLKPKKNLNFTLNSDLIICNGVSKIAVALFLIRLKLVLKMTSQTT